METFKSENDGSPIEYDTTRKASTSEKFDPEAQIISHEFNAYSLQ